MRFSCDQQKLTKALNIVSKAVTSRTTIPVLKGIMMEVNEDGTLTMSASDLDISIQNTIEVDDSEPGSVIVMAKLFGDIIRKLPSQRIDIQKDEENNVSIQCMSSNFEVRGMSADDFPTLNSDIEKREWIDFDKRSFQRMIEKTSFAASIDESRGIITGVLIELAPDEMDMVAIDGYRMAINRKDQVNRETGKIVVPAKIINEIARIISDIGVEEETGKIAISDKKIIFNIDNIQAELKLLDGEFIKYKDIIPKESKIEMVIDRHLLLESIERASLLSKAGKNNLIRVKIEDTLVTITSNSEEGNVKEEVIVEKQGEDLTIGFNAQYLMDVLKAIDDDEIKMLFSTPITPCMIEPVEGREYEYLILPVRIN